MEMWQKRIMCCEQQHLAVFLSNHTIRNYYQAHFIVVRISSLYPFLF